jgi:hypothetical protein
MTLGNTTEKIFGCSQGHAFSIYNISSNRYYITPFSHVSVVMPSSQKAPFNFAGFDLREAENTEREALRVKLRERIDFRCLYCDQTEHSVHGVIKHLKDPFHGLAKTEFKKNIHIYS